MSKVNKSLLKGAQEALEYAKGNKKGAVTHKVKIPDRVDVVKIRDKLHMTRQEFSDVFGFKMRTLEKWERGERVPEGPTRAYLIVIDKDSKAVKKALSSSGAVTKTRGKK